MPTRFSILLLLGLAFAGCGGSNTSTSMPAAPTPTPTPTATTNATFSNIQHDIFETSDPSGRAACTNCHTSAGRSPAGGLDLSHAAAYDQLVNIPSRAAPASMRVIPGNANGSYLVHTIEGTPDIVGKRMPLNGPYLSDAQIAIIKQWIANGAARN